MKRAPTSNKHARTPSVSFADFALIATEKKSERKAQLPSLFFFFFFFFLGGGFTVNFPEKETAANQRWVKTGISFDNFLHCALPCALLCLPCASPFALLFFFLPPFPYLFFFFSFLAVL